MAKSRGKITRTWRRRRVWDRIKQERRQKKENRRRKKKTGARTKSAPQESEVSIRYEGSPETARIRYLYNWTKPGTPPWPGVFEWND